MIFAFIAALVLAAGATYWLVSRRAARQPKPAPRPAKGGRFGAVEIRTRSGACSAARALDGHRFLAKDAPALPLPKCGVARCACTFSKLPDRRSDGRRLDYGALSGSQFLATNRRTKRDRRRAAHARRQR
jgi:hypothetical protein